MITLSRPQIISVGRLGAAVGLGFVSTLYAMESLNWGPDRDVFYDLVFIGSLVLSFIFGFGLGDLRRVWVGLLGFLAVNITFLAFCIATEHFWLFRFGAFGGSNYLAVAIALGFAGALAYRQWWFIPFAIFGLLFTESRTAIAAVVLTFLLWGGRRFWLISLLALAIGAGAIYQKPAADRSFVSRLGIWQDTINHMKPFGNGWGSFQLLYPTFTPKTNAFNENARHAYNDGLELIFDLGIGAIPLFLLVILALECAAADRLIVWTFLILSLSFFPFFELGVAQVFFLTLGRLYKADGDFKWLAGV